MSLGFITMAVFIASLSLLLDNYYKRRTYLKMHLKTVLKFLKTISVNCDKIKSYYNILWEMKNGVPQAMQFHSLPYPLKCEICVDVNISFFQTSLIFQDKPDAFLRRVSNLMKHEFYQTGELIYQKDVVKNKAVKNNLKKNIF